MDKVKFGALFISVFFIVSIVASGFLYTPPPVDQGPTDQLPDINPTQISMQAEEVEAKIVLLLPKLRIGASTSETNIANIDSSIYAIEGVKRVASFYTQSDGTELAAGLIYVADIQLSSDDDAEQVFSQVQQIESLESVDGFASALVSVPEEIEFTNFDLNVSKSQSLKRNETEALVSFETIMDDRVLVNISATFIGPDAIEVAAFEVENITGAPSFGESTLEAEVASLDTIMLVDIKTDYSGLAGLGAVEQGLSSLPFTDFNLSKPYLEAKISLVKDENISDSVAPDLNTFLYTLSNDVIFYNQSFFRASVFFEDGTDLKSVKDAINERLQSLGLDDITLQEPVGHATASTTISADAPFAEASSIIKSYGFENFSLIQPGKISLAEITSDETEKTYAIDSGVVETAFSEQHSLGETVQVDVVFSIVRGEITSISATEKE